MFFSTAERLCIRREVPVKPATKGKPRKNFVPYRGACGSDMPENLNIWLSVGKVPKGDNVTELKKQTKRKRADDEGN